MNADMVLALLRTALDELADAESRYARIRAEEQATHPELPPKVCDIRAAGRQDMRDAMTDWSTAHTRIQSYSAAYTALRLAERRPVPKPPADTSWVQSTEDSHELHPAARSDGLPVDERASYAVPGRRSA